MCFWFVLVLVLGLLFVVFFSVLVLVCFGVFLVCFRLFLFLFWIVFVLVLACFGVFLVCFWCVLVCFCLFSFVFVCFRSCFGVFSFFFVCFRSCFVCFCMLVCFVDQSCGRRVMLCFWGPFSWGGARSRALARVNPSPPPDGLRRSRCLGSSMRRSQRDGQPSCAKNKTMFKASLSARHRVARARGSDRVVTIYCIFFCYPPAWGGHEKLKCWKTHFHVFLNTPCVSSLTQRLRVRNPAPGGCACPSLPVVAGDSASCFLYRRGYFRTKKEGNVVYYKNKNTLHPAVRSKFFVETHLRKLCTLYSDRAYNRGCVS